MFPADLEQTANALGYPTTALLPEGVARGPAGFRHDQQAGITPVYPAGSIIDIPTATGVARLGGVLDTFSESAKPDVVARVSGFQLRVQVEASQSPTAQVTEQFLSELNAQLAVRWKPSNGAAMIAPLYGSVSQYAANSSATDTTTAGANQYRALPTSVHSGLWAPAVPGCEVDLSMDTFQLFALNDIVLPAGSIVRLDLWCRALLVGKEMWDGKRNKCAGNGDKALLGRAGLAHKTRTLDQLK